MPGKSKNCTKCGEVYNGIMKNCPSCYAKSIDDKVSLSAAEKFFRVITKKKKETTFHMDEINKIEDDVEELKHMYVHDIQKKDAFLYKLNPTQGSPKYFLDGEQAKQKYMKILSNGKTAYLSLIPTSDLGYDQLSQLMNRILNKK